MSQNSLKLALQHQADALKTRADWQQKMIDRQIGTIEKAQNAIEFFSNELAATNLALDSLRAEYRTLTGKDTE